ncbi:MAG: hypothetical protein ACLFTA_03480 [Candidatus Nanohaloarchaea archaeon]
MDLKESFSGLKNLEYMGGLIAGFTAISLVAYLIDGSLPDLASTIAFIAVFTLAYLVLEKISVF